MLYLRGGIPHRKFLQIWNPEGEFGGNFKCLLYVPFPNSLSIIYLILQEDMVSATHDLT